MIYKLIRDRNGKHIAQVLDNSDGKIILMNRNSQKIATYYSKLNITCDNRGVYVGSGNLLFEFIESMSK